MTYTPWHDVLKSAYKSVYANTFPIGIGQAIGGIANGLTGATAGWMAQQQQQFQFPQERVYYSPQHGYHVTKAELDFARDGHVVIEESTSFNWLDARVEKVRKLGRDWLGPKVVKREKFVPSVAIKNSPYPPPVGGMREPLVAPDGSGVLFDPQAMYTKRLRNGDEVRVYPMKQDFN